LIILIIKTITESDGIKSTFSGFRLPDYFRLDQMIQEYNFASDEDIEKNKRYRLIMLRAQNEPEFRGYRMIPANDRSVRKDQFDAYEKRKIKDLAGDDEEEKPDDTMRSGKLKDMENEIEMSRARGQKIVRRIREQILKQFKFTQSQKTLSDMIIEEQVPNIKFVFFEYFS
jgi:coiled-coil and C2 domain-containing protein 2A